MNGSKIRDHYDAKWLTFILANTSKAVKGQANVGVVKFDNHPGLEFKSGDELFQ